MAWPPPRGAEKLVDWLCDCHRAGHHEAVNSWCPMCENESNMTELQKMTVTELRRALSLTAYPLLEVAAELMERVEEAEAFRLHVIKRCEEMMKLTKGE